jgi:YD repeat-containing protein
VTNPAGQVTVYGFDQAGHMIKRTDPDGKTWVAEKDSADRLLSMTDPLGHRETWTYDSNGRELTHSLPSGLVMTTQRDPVTGYPTALLYADGTRETRVFDGVGNVLVRRDALGRSTSYTYTSSGQILTQVDSQGRRTRYTYEPHARGGRGIGSWFFAAGSCLPTQHRDKTGP